MVCKFYEVFRKKFHFPPKFESWITDSCGPTPWSYRSVLRCDINLIIHFSDSDLPYLIHKMLQRSNLVSMYGSLGYQRD